MPSDFDDVPPGDWFCPSCGSKIEDANVSQQNYDGCCDDMQHANPDQKVYGDTVTILCCQVCKVNPKVFEFKVKR